MKDKEGLENLMKLISDKFGVSIENINKDTKLKSDLRFDSLDSVELIMEIEEKYNIKMPDEESDKLGEGDPSIYKLYQYLQTKGYK